MVTAAKLVHHVLEQLRDFFVTQGHHTREDAHDTRFVNLVEWTEQHPRRIRADHDIRSTHDHRRDAITSRSGSLRYAAQKFRAHPTLALRPIRPHASRALGSRPAHRGT